MAFRSLCVMKSGTKSARRCSKDVVTASVMITDGSLTLEDAKAKMEELCGSRPTASSESRYGKVVESGDFKLWFSMDSDKESESFYVVKKDAMFLWYEDKSAYKELNKSVAEQAKWENGNRYKVTAKVDDFILSNWKDYSSSKVTGSDGQSYIGCLRLRQIPRAVRNRENLYVLWHRLVSGGNRGERCAVHGNRRTAERGIPNSQPGLG